MSNEDDRQAIHVSVRLPWHDRSWDGKQCDDPINNWYCAGFHSVNAERIRTYKKVNDQKRCQSIDDTENIFDNPPCTETINVFGQETVTLEHIPPDFMLKGGTKKGSYV